MKDPNIWAKAAGQILFSLSVGFGGQLVLASYNNFKNNTLRDSLLIGLCNSLTSLYAGIVVFLILGFLAQTTGQTSAEPSTFDEKQGISIQENSIPQFEKFCLLEIRLISFKACLYFSKREVNVAF